MAISSIFPAKCGGTTETDSAFKSTNLQLFKSTNNQSKAQQSRINFQENDNNFSAPIQNSSTKSTQKSIKNNVQYQDIRKYFKSSK